MKHHTALVADDVVLADVTVEPFAVVSLNGPSASPAIIGAGTTIRSHAVVYRGAQLGRGVHIGHGALVREETRIGDHSSVGSHTMIEHHVTIGASVRIHGGAFIPEHSVLGDGAWIGPGVIVTNARYPAQPDTKDRLEGVTIGEAAVVGAGAVILPGVTIGAGALVGAGAVVVGDVAEGARVVGNPSRRLAGRDG